MATGHKKMRFKTIITVLALLLIWTTAWGQEAPPEQDAVSQNLETLTSIEKPDSDQQEEIDILRTVIDKLKDIESIRQERNGLEQQINRAPEEMQRLERSLRDTMAGETVSAETLKSLDTSALETRVADTLNRLQTLQDDLAKTNSRLIAAQTLPERAQTTISGALEEIEKKRLALGDYSGAGNSPKVWLLRSELALSESKLALKRRQLAVNTRLLELASRQREVLIRRIDQIEDNLTLMQAILDQKRRDQLENTLGATSGSEPSVADDNKAVIEARSRNRQMSLELLQVIDRYNVLKREGIKVRTQLERVRQVQRTLKEQIEAVRGSQLLSRILREQRSSLPQVDTVKGIQEQIADIRLKQFDLNRQRDGLRDAERFARQQLDETGAKMSPQVIETLTKLYQGRSELVDQLEREYGELLTTAIDLQLNQQQLLEISSSLRMIIEEQLFWVASRNPLDLTWLRQLPQLLMAQLSGEGWRQKLHHFWQKPHLAGLWGMPLLLLSIGLLLRRRPIKARLLTLHEQIGRLKRDTQMHTPRAIMLNALIAAPGPLALAAIGIAMRHGGAGIAVAWGEALLQLSLAWGAVALARRLLVFDGVSVRHFHWPAAYATRLRNLLWWQVGS